MSRIENNETQAFDPGYRQLIINPNDLDTSVKALEARYADPEHIKRYGPIDVVTQTLDLGNNQKAVSLSARSTLNPDDPYHVGIGDTNVLDHAGDGAQGVSYLMAGGNFGIKSLDEIRHYQEAIGLGKAQPSAQDAPAPRSKFVNEKGELTELGDTGYVVINPADEKQAVAHLSAYAKEVHKPITFNRHEITMPDGKVAIALSSADPDFPLGRLGEHDMLLDEGIKNFVADKKFSLMETPDDVRYECDKLKVGTSPDNRSPSNRAEMDPSLTTGTTTSGTSNTGNMGATKNAQMVPGMTCAPTPV